MFPISHADAAFHRDGSKLCSEIAKNVPSSRKKIALWSRLTGKHFLFSRFSRLFSLDELS